MMALVTSDETITVIILESKDEVEALTKLLEESEDHRSLVLDELTNALVGAA
tara:strand:+ start:317 stop:472 length:156 start_codon:yes stop_codon:yes gene_type:complete